MSEEEPESRLREVVHQRVRLGVLAVLDRQGPCTFPQLRDALGQSDGGLSRHLGVLEEHGYIATEKVFENRRPRTWVRLTAAGREAFEEEQELLGKLLARTRHDTGQDGVATSGGDPGGGDHERTAAMTIVFAALLAADESGEDGSEDGSGEEGEDAGDPVARGRAPVPGERPDRSRLIPAVPALAGQPMTLVVSGPVSARYEFPADCGELPLQREQRMMMISHGLRGGWTTAWRGGELAAYTLVVELAAAYNCEAILAAMAPPTVDLPGAPGARGYTMPAGGAGSPPAAVAWLSAGPFLACASVVPTTGPAPVPALVDLATEVHRALTADTAS